MQQLWDCEKCGTKNPEASSYCQTCGEQKEEQRKMKLKRTRQSSETKTTTLSETLLTAAEQKLGNQDYSALQIIANVSLMLGIAIIVVFVIGSFVAFQFEFNIIVFLIQLVVAALISLSCFTIAYLIELLVMMKEEVNYLTQCQYVNVKLNEQILETLKTMQDNHSAQFESTEK